MRNLLLEVFAEIGASRDDAVARVSLVASGDLWLDLVELELAELAGLLVNQAAGGSAVDDYLAELRVERRRDEEAMLAGPGPEVDDDEDPSA